MFDSERSQWREPCDFARSDAKAGCSVQAYTFAVAFETGVASEPLGVAAQEQFVMAQTKTLLPSTVRSPVLITPRQALALLLLGKHVRLQHIRTLAEARLAREEEERAAMRAALGKIFNFKFSRSFGARGKSAPAATAVALLRGESEAVLACLELGGSREVRARVARLARKWQRNTAHAVQRRRCEAAALTIARAWRQRAARRAGADAAGAQLPPAPLGARLRRRSQPVSEGAHDRDALRQRRLPRPIAEGTSQRDASGALELRPQPPQEVLPDPPFTSRGLISLPQRRKAVAVAEGRSSSGAAPNKHLAAYATSPGRQRRAPSAPQRRTHAQSEGGQSRLPAQSDAAVPNAAPQAGVHRRPRTASAAVPGPPTATQARGESSGTTSPDLMQEEWLVGCAADAVPPLRSSGPGHARQRARTQGGGGARAAASAATATGHDGHSYGMRHTIAAEHVTTATRRRRNTHSERGNEAPRGVGPADGETSSIHAVAPELPVRRAVVVPRSGAQGPVSGLLQQMGSMLADEVGNLLGSGSWAKDSERATAMSQPKEASGTSHGTRSSTSSTALLTRGANWDQGASAADVKGEAERPSAVGTRARVRWGAAAEQATGLDVTALAARGKETAGDAESPRLRIQKVIATARTDPVVLAQNRFLGYFARVRGIAEWRSPLCPIRILRLARTSCIQASFDRT